MKILFREPKAPIEVGEIHNVKIEAVGKEGDGIARVSGFVIFVPNTKVGEEVKVKISKVLQRFAIAEVMESL